MAQTGLFFGFLLGFLLKWSRLNFTAKLKQPINRNSHTLLTILLIIVPQSLILFLLVAAKVVVLPDNPDYSISAVILGSFLFGVGMVLARGCIVDNLVQVGSLDINALISIVVFIFTLLFYNRGLFAIDAVENGLVSSDRLIHQLHFPPLLLVVACFVLLIGWLIWTVRSSKDQPTTGRLFKRSLNPLLAAGIIGILAGAAYWVNSLGHSFGSFAIISPLLSWYAFIKGHGAGIDLSWGMYFVLSIIIGAFICTICQGEFKFRFSGVKALVGALGGGFLMGIGAGLAKGTLFSNGLVFTAMLSIQGWLALAFIILGCWLTGLLATFIFRLFAKH